MTLTPPKFHIADDMPMSLGKAIARAIAPQPDRIEAFNKGQHSHIAFNSATKTCLLTPISEKDCRQIKGAAQASRKVAEAGTTRPSPVAAPHSVQKFRVGDRVRWSQEVMDKSRFLGPENPPWVIDKINGERAYDHDGTYADLNDLELVPPPASETETEGDGWIEHRPGDPCPVEPEVIVHCKNSTGHPSPCAPTPARTWAWGFVTAYRVVKP